MKSFLKKWRKENLNNIGKYLLYALGEILLIIIGILIAININESLKTKNDNKIRCQYLQELSFAFDHDIKDIESNIEAFEERNFKMKEVLIAIQEKKLSEVDSLNEKINVFLMYVFFVQQSKSKIEELKYSTLNLITDRSLKNRILLYQESKIYFLLDQEKRYNVSHEEVRKYVVKKFSNLTPDIMQKEKEFFSVALQKYEGSRTYNINHKDLLKELYEIKKLIEAELEGKCGGVEKE